jgi:osmoprotectant transport system permease protein
LRQNDNDLLLAGALASALLALLCDFALGQFEKSYAIGERGSATSRKLLSGGVVLIFALAIIVSYLPGVRTQNAFSANNTIGKTIIVGSKDFTESVILAEILAQLLEKQGVTVSRRFELGGNLPHEALLAKQIDIYPEYTGTAYTAILKHAPITDPQAVYDQTRAEYADRFKLNVSPSIGFSNDFAILVRGDEARKKNLKTISDAVPISRNWQAGFGQDFMSRADGYPGFSKAYGFSFAKQPREMDLSLTYRALQSGELDIIAGNSTDGLISALDLFQLADDKHYFPPYQAVFIYRQDVAELLAPTLARLNSAISTDEMRRLNYEVDGNKRTSADVAAEWIAKIKLAN